MSGENRDVLKPGLGPGQPRRNQLDCSSEQGTQGWRELRHTLAIAGKADQNGNQQQEANATHRARSGLGQKGPLLH
jgi:hypothetical protein